MIYIWLNIVPILIAALAAVGIGAAWYRRAFARSTVLVLLTAQAWLAAILAGAIILAPPRGGVWTMTIGSAVVIWVGFVAPAIVASYRIRGLPWRDIARDASYWLVTMIAQAAIMRAIGLTAPPT